MAKATKSKTVKKLAKKHGIKVIDIKLSDKGKPEDFAFVRPSFVGEQEILFMDELPTHGEVLIHPRTVWTYNKPHSDGETPVEIFNDCIRGTEKVGDLSVAFAGAPGTGRTVHRITRIDDTGIWGVLIEDTMRELEPWEVE